MANFPQMNLSPEATPWGRAAQDRIATLEAQVSALRQSMENSLRTVNGSLANIGETVKILNASANVQYSEFNNTIGGFSGWYGGSLPTITLSSPTGRIELGYGGVLNGGDGYFCYSITGQTSGTIVARGTILASPARRVAVTGGASFAPSGWHSGVVSVPANELLTIQLQINVSSSAVSVFGGSIYARVTP